MSARKKLLILDDESDTVSFAIRNDLEDSATVSAPKLFKADGSVDIGVIAKALSDDPDLILLDVIWKSGMNVPIILEQAFEQIQPYRRLQCCLITAYHQDERGRRHLRDGYQKTLGSKLTIVGVAAKPLTSEGWDDFLKNIRARIAAPSFNISFDLHEMKLPGRILNNIRAVQGQNEAWAWTDEIPPANLLGEREFVVPDTSDKFQFGRYFKEYRITEVPLVGARTLQIAAPISSGHSTGINQVLEQTYNLLRSGGFTRMRFYQRIRVPGSDGMLSLRQQFPKQRDLNTSVLQRPLDGQLLRKFHEYQLSDWPDHNDLVCDIVSDGEQRHAGECQPLSLLRLPVFCRYDDLVEHRIQARGMIVLDKLGASDTSIVLDEVMKKKVSLLTACRQLSRALQAEYNLDRQESIDKVFSFYRKTTENISVIDHPEHFQNEFLKFSCDCSEAMQARLHLTSYYGALPIEIAHYPGSDAQLGDGQFSEEVFPTCWQAWTTGEPAFRPKHAQADHKVLHSRVAFPLKVSGQIFGILSLQHPAPFHFTHRRVAALRRVIDLFVFPLHLARERLSRRLWETSLAHALMETNVFLSQYHSLLEDKGNFGELPEFKKIGAASLRMMDIATGFIEYSRIDEAVPKGQPTDATRLLSGALQFAGSMLNDAKHAIEQRIGDSQIVINADASRVEFVLRTLLHNAIYHGKPGAIFVSSGILDDYWLVEIQNPADIPEVDFDAMFKPFSLSSAGRHATGSHIGLALARHWAGLYGATLVARKGDRTITFILKWPISNS